jgi:hypothetical protein
MYGSRGATDLEFHQWQQDAHRAADEYSRQHGYDDSDVMVRATGVLSHRVLVVVAATVVALLTFALI